MPGRSIRTALALPVVLILVATTRAEEPKEPPLGPETRGYDMLHLDLTVDLDMDAGSLEGKAVHRLKSLRDGLARVRMHLKDMQVSAVTAGGEAARGFDVAEGILAIDLAKPLAKDEELELVIEYGGKPESGIWFFRPENDPSIPRQVWTQGQREQNRHWIPMYDLPDERLTTTLRIEVPTGMVTLSNGTPGAVIDGADGRSLHEWNMERPHPPYLITLVAGEFDVRERDAAGVPQFDYVPPGWGKWCDEVFGRTPDMMGFFQDYTGQPYPWKRYSQVTVWDFQWGGMENTGATTLNMRALHREGIRPDYSADGLVAHELAHMWFGDLITCATWNHIWLNEGFATYFTDLWVEHHHGADDFVFARNRSKNGYLGGVDSDAIARRPVATDPTACGDIERKPYVKGSTVLHMLRHLLGADVLRDGVRRYVSEARDKAVETEALRSALESESGESLAWFFDQWVYGSGVPELAVAATWDDATKTLAVTVEQTQRVSDSRPLFQTPVDIEITWSDGTVTRRRDQLHLAKHTWRITGPGKPKIVRFDPEDWLAAKVTNTKPREEWETQLAEATRAIGRATAARALGGMGVDASNALGKAAREDESHFVRAEACDALGKIGGNLAGGHLVAAAEDKDSRVRSSALEALGNIPAPWSTATLLKHLAEDESVYAAAEAALALGKVKAPEAFHALEAALRRDSHRDVIRQKALEGLKELGDPRGAEFARMHVGYELGGGIQHRMRHAAIDALVALAPHDESTHALLVKLCLDPYFRMRNWAAAHAADLGVEAAIPNLERSARTGLGPGVRRAAKQALAMLRGPKKTKDDTEKTE